MADKKRVLIVTQEMKPYTSMTDLSDLVNRYAQLLQESNMEIRILMPKFGTINERRHRLHEVVRLSGMNITVDDDDYPLIIKVASLPSTRMQVYFLDNEDFFKRKQIFEDKDGKLFDDNLDRTLFFSKGVIETVKKFGWAPDVVHVHGWMLSLLPAILKTTASNEPIFQNSKVVYTASDATAINASFDASFADKMNANGLESILEHYTNDGSVQLNQGAAHYADGVLLQKSDTSIENIESSAISFEDEFTEKCLEFYENSLAEAE
jgi:starch synthase